MHLGRWLKSWGARIFPAALLILVSSLTGTVGVQAFSGAVHGTLHAAYDLTQASKALPSITVPDCPLCVASHTPGQTPQAPTHVRRLASATGRITLFVDGPDSLPRVRSHSPRAPPRSLS